MSIFAVGRLYQAVEQKPGRRRCSEADMRSILSFQAEAKSFRTTFAGGSCFSAWVSNYGALRDQIVDVPFGFP